MPLLKICAEFSPVEHSAFETVLSQLQLEDDETTPVIPSYFKLGTILGVDSDEKRLSI